MKKSMLIISILVVLVIGAAAWYLLSPLFIDNVVNEELPETILPSANPAEEPTTVTLGTFTDADSFHKVSGQALLVQKSTLRFENFDATNGPDLKVYLANDLEASDYVSLGELKGNKGNQNYPVPESVNIDDYDYVLIWCEQFSVLFGYADI